MVCWPSECWSWTVRRMNVNAGPGRPGGPGPPHKRSRADYHGHGGYDDYPNLREFLERKDEKLPPNHILLITVLNAKYPINVEVMYKVCTIVGNIRRVVCFERNTVVQVLSLSCPVQVLSPRPHAIECRQWWSSRPWRAPARLGPACMAVISTTTAAL